jgi:transcription elongation factor GreA
MSEIWITTIEHDRLRHELDELRERQRIALAEQLATLPETIGDPADNTELLEERRDVEIQAQRIDELERRLQQAVIVKPETTGGVVGIGVTVRIVEDDADGVEDFEIVGSHQGDPEQGRIAYDSPLGRAICGHRAGEVVDIVAPIGVRHARIVAVGS